jgi:protein-tyrosine phosphatase
MIDLHTHLLPDWDDGAKDWSEFQKMCEIARTDGITAIVLTPHIFRMTKYGDDFELLERRMADFAKHGTGSVIRFYRGAEVFVQHDMAKIVRDKHLTLNGSNYLFIEFPADYVLPTVRDLLYALMLDGFIPIISHPERNAVFAEHPDLFFDLIQMGALGQLTAKSVRGEFGSSIKKTADLFLDHKLVHIIASDAHDPEKRPPKLRAAVDEAAKIVGRERAEAMVTTIPQAILDDKPIPDYGEPVDPVKPRRKWSIRLPRFGRD